MLRSFLLANVPIAFFKFSSTENAACRNHYAIMIIVKRFIQERNNVTRVGFNPDHAIRVVVTTLYPLSSAADNRDHKLQAKLSKEMLLKLILVAGWLSFGK